MTANADRMLTHLADLIAEGMTARRRIEAGIGSMSHQVEKLKHVEYSILETLRGLVAELKAGPMGDDILPPSLLDSLGLTDG